MKQSMHKKRSLKASFLGLVLAMVLLAGAGIGAVDQKSFAAENGGKRFQSEFSSKAATKVAGDEVNRQVTAEGFALFKNEDNALPLARGNRISMFGRHSGSPVYGGSGSSGGAPAGAAKPTQSLEAAGLVLNPSLISLYGTSGALPAGSMDRISYGFAVGEFAQDRYTSDIKGSWAEDYNDAAIVWISRIAGEGYDMPSTSATNANMTQAVAGARSITDHYLQLNQDETDLIKMLDADPAFSKIIVIVNSSTQVELGFLDDPQHYAYSSKIKAAMWVAAPGFSGMDSLGKLLVGDINPSARTVSIWARDFKKDPAFQNSGYNQTNNGNRYYVGNTMQTGLGGVEYQEGIYMGYRYYETRAITETENPDWYKQNVVYPFGYGLSYTTFEWTLEGTNPAQGSALIHDGEISVSVKVKNTGTMAGKEVVQLYYTAPYTVGGIEKAYVNLGGFEKTKLLAPGEEQTVVVKMPVREMASYDWNDKNGNGFKGYELDPGAYTIRMSKNSHDAVINIDYTIESNIKYTHDEKTGAPIANRFDDVSNRQLKYDNTEIFASGARPMKYMSRADFVGTFPTTPTQADKTLASSAVVNMLNGSGTSGNNANATPVDEPGRPWYRDTMPTYQTSTITTIKFGQLVGKAYDDPLWEQFLDNMTINDYSTLITRGLYSINGLPSLDVPASSTPDGPLGLTGTGSGNDHTRYAAPVVLSATFNKELAAEVGKIIGNEALWGNAAGNTINGWYAPGFNTHRTPFGGRNFEYYSEDGLLGGLIGGQVVREVTARGVIAFIKHYALNDQETNRVSNLYTWLDEQAMREIYLKPFEIAVKEGNALGVMSAFNRVGSLWAGASYALCTEILRDEWGFRGVVVTDYYNASGYNMGINMGIRAGNDLPLGNIAPNKAETPTNVSALRNAAKNVLYAVAHSNKAVNKIGANNTPGTNMVYTGTRDLIGVKGISINTSLVPDNAVNGITYSLLEGSLPAGVTFVDGVLSGVPTSSGAFNFIIRTEASGYIGTDLEYTMTIVDMHYPEVELDTGKVGSELEVDIATAIGTGTVTYSLKPESGNLPNGVTLTEEGVLRGTPSVAGTFTFTVIASNGEDSVEREMVLVVEKGSLNFTGLASNGSLPSLEVGVSLPSSQWQSYSIAAATGGSGNITYSVSGLPEGLSFAANNRRISGTPLNAGSYEVIFIAENDNYYQEAVVTYVVEKGSLTYRNQTLTAGRANSSYSVSIANATGDNNPEAVYTYTVVEADRLPLGITLNADGTLSGTAIIPGTYSFRVLASTADREAEATITMTVRAALSFYGFALPFAEVELDYLASVDTATAADRPTMTYALADGSELPAGLTLDTTGKITGKPSTVGSYTFYIIATETETGISAEAKFSFTVNAARNFDAILEAIEAIETELAELTGRMDTAETEIAKITLLQEAVNSLNSRVETLQGLIGEGGELELGDILDDIDAIKLKVAALETEIDNIALTPGPDGKSAYDVAVENGFEGTVQEWLASLQGAKGDNGKSAYEIAVENGFEGTITEWLVSLKGEQGDAAKSIVSIAKTSSDELVDTYTITYSDSTTDTFTVTNGADGINGTDGKGITDIKKTGTEGNVDTYTITYTDSTQTTFTVNNGTNGTDGADGKDGSDGKGVAIASIVLSGTVAAAFVGMIIFRKKFSI